MPSFGGVGDRESHLCDTSPFCLGKAGTATSAMSEKVRTRLEELDDFEEVSEQVLGRAWGGSALSFLLPSETRFGGSSVMNSQAALCALSCRGTSRSRDGGQRCSWLSALELPRAGFLKVSCPCDA